MYYSKSTLPHTSHSCPSFSHRYYVEFSKPSKDKPIPEGVVNVFFNIIQREQDDFEIEFSFESESLKHKLDKTMRPDMFQVSLQPYPTCLS